MASKRDSKRKDERLLIIALDIDNDLYRKTKIIGPLIGRVQCLSGATQLALADPEDTDSNSMFYAVRMYDNMKEEGYNVEVCTITGSEDEGYNADREISRQLELVLENQHYDGCIFVSDGASDERVIPVIQSRIKIDSVQTVKIKKAEGIENTYFAVLEKLKEPHYSRIVFGLPALIILLFVFSSLIGAGWLLPAALISLYLLIKGFGLEDFLISSVKGLGFSADSMSFVFYLTSLIFLAAGVVIALGNYYSRLAVTNNQALAVAYMAEGFLIFFPVVLVLYLIGRVIDTRLSRYIFRSFKYGIYIGSSIILWVMLYSFTEWLAGQIYFGQFVTFTGLAILTGVSVSLAAGLLRARVLSRQKLKGKIVVNEVGASIGKIADTDVKKGRIVINTNFGNQITYSVDRIIELSDKVVVR